MTNTTALTDDELRRHGIGEPAIALRRRQQSVTWFAGLPFCPDCTPRAACAKHSGPTTLTTAATPAPKPDRGRTGPKRASTPHRSEASVQREIVMALKAVGFYVRRIGQRNAKGTMDPGVPDVYALRRYTIAPPRAGRAIWIEVKAPKRGRQSRAQREFQRQCEAAGVRYILAKSVDDIRELL